jgi:hypothetical protein
MPATIAYLLAMALIVGAGNNPKATKHAFHAIGHGVRAGVHKVIHK